jgi:glycosyltransferase involved in cell wall biosynthesis
MKIFTWHIHGNYLYYLSQIDAEIYIPYQEGREGYGGKSGSFKWGKNIHQVPTDEVKNLNFDVILYQSKKNYLEDQFDTLSPEQRKLPKLYLEHDPPREHPTDTKHIVEDPSVHIVHVTHFNNLMWDNNNCPTHVIEHGIVTSSDVTYSGKLEKGIVVINNIHKRGRRLGSDIFERVRKVVPLDIVGMGYEEVNGLGEVPPEKMAEFISQYRFFFYPIRYTSLGLALCEAMMIGMPIVALQTTEVATTILNDFNGYADTNVDALILKMNLLLNNVDLAKKLGDQGKKYANERFNIKRFSHDWMKLFTSVSKNKTAHLNTSITNYEYISHTINQ